MLFRSMGLKRARASVLTAFSGSLEVSWSVVNVTWLNVQIKSPLRTSGVFELGELREILTGKTEYGLLVKMY